MCEVYDDVSATLSQEAIDIIQKSGDVLLILHKHIKTARPVHVLRGQCHQYSLTGTLSGIVEAKEELSSLLKTLENGGSISNGSCNKQFFTSSEHNPSVDDVQIKQVSNLRQRDQVDTGSRSVKRKAHHPKSHKVTFKQSYFCRLSNKRRNKHSRISDPDVLSRNLERMKLSGTENSSDAESRLHSDSTYEKLSVEESYTESSDSYKFYCKTCSFKTSRSSHFQKHLTIHDKVSSLFKCSQCNFTTIRTSHLRRHEMTHSSTFHTCKQCNYRTDDVKLLLRHMRLKHCKAHKEKYSNVLSCPSCSYQTTLPRYFERHQRFHCSKQGDKLYQCEKCCYKTHRKEHYTRHVSTVHINQRNFLCHLCGRSFKRADALQQHHQTHETDKDSNLNFRCNICEKAFKTLSHLNEHKAVHSNSRLFLCEICGSSFKTRSVQRKHISTIHKNPRSYSCHSCGKRFNTLYAMKRHHKVHLSGITIPKRHVEFEPTEISSFTSDSAEEIKQINVEALSSDSDRNGSLMSHSQSETSDMAKVIPLKNVNVETTDCFVGALKMDVSNPPSVMTSNNAVLNTFVMDEALPINPLVVVPSSSDPVICTIVQPQQEQPLSVLRFPHN